MKKIIIILSVLIVVGILGFMGYSLLTSSKVPSAFIEKHNEIVALEKEAEKISDLTAMPEMEALNGQMSSEDYTGALKSVEAALGRKKDAATKLNSVDSGLSELESISGKISDSKIKTSAGMFINTAKKENFVKISYNNLQIKMLEELKKMVDILAKNSKAISATDEKAINDSSKVIENIKNQISQAEEEVDKIQSQYKEAEKEFFGLAGLEIKK